MIDGGLNLDLDAVVQNIGEADVVAFYFPTIRRTLLVDTRRAEGVGPMIRVVPMARNSSERLHSIQRLRLMFPCPESLTMIPWVARVRSLVTLGIWEHLLARLDNVEAATACLDDLCTREGEELRNAITGKRYRALWSRTGEERSGGYHHSN